MKIKTILFSSGIITVFLGASLKVYWDKNQPFPAGEIQNFSYQISLSSLEKIYGATGNEAQWDGVRELISFVRMVSLEIDKLLLGFKQSGLFSLSGTYTHNDGTYNMKLVMNDPQTITLSAGVTKEFSHRLILWNASTNGKYLELYFDDPDNASGDGAVVTWEPAIMNSTSYNTGKRMECYTDPVNQTMICSWNGPIEQGGIVNTAQTIVKISDGTMNIRFLAGTTNTSINGSNCTTRAYYTLGAIVKTVEPYYTTAAFGYNCDTEAYTLAGSSNPYNYGFFNTNQNPGAVDSTKFFHTIASTPPSADYPSTADVDNLLSLEPSKATVDAINVTFKSTDTAP